MKLRFAAPTERFIATYSASLPHAVILTGQQGIGLNTLANHLASRNGTILSIVLPESKSSAVASINVDQIRELYVETRAKLSGKNFVIIDDADTMNITAQNALLKLLEEPNESICFILTSHNPDKLLPTIRSRAQSFVVPPISQVDSKRILDALNVTDTVTQQRILYVAAGLPAEISRLIQHNADFTKLLERVQQAKQLVEGSSYQRAASVFSLTSDRQELLRTIEMALLLLRRSLKSKPDEATLHNMNRLMKASEVIRANGNARLHIMRAMLQ